MKSSWDYTQDIIGYVIDKQPSTQSAMLHAINVLAPHLSNKTSKIIQSIDFGAWEKKLLAHLSLVLSKEPPPIETIAFYFGLFDQQTCLLHKYEHQTMYICGADHFASDDDGEWACGPIWFPRHRYFPCSLYKKFSRFEEPNDLMTGFILAQTFAAAFALTAAPLLARSVDADRHPVPVACGHDAGGLFVICYATPEGIEKP